MSYLSHIIHVIGFLEKMIDNFHDLLIINIKMLCYSCLMITVLTYDKQTWCSLIFDQYDNCYVSIKEITHY